MNPRQRTLAAALWAYQCGWEGGIVDYESGETGGDWQWGIYPSDRVGDDDALVLAGVAGREDPTPALDAIVRLHNRALGFRAEVREVVRLWWAGESAGSLAVDFEDLADQIVALLAPAPEPQGEGE
ncbi:MAG TPA: hypothetical protein VGW74_06895 [Propionibacteriaceae bacterium]|nr:hypothetical protein [Propionibacteriaceae bacterium]